MTSNMSSSCAAEHGVVRRELAAETVRAVRTLADAAGASPFSALVAGISVVLSRYVGTEDLVLGLRVVQPLVRRVHVDPDGSLHDLVTQIRGAGKATAAPLPAGEALPGAGGLPWGHSGGDPVTRPRLLVALADGTDHGRHDDPVDADATLTVALRPAGIGLSLTHGPSLGRRTAASFLEACEHVLADAEGHARPIGLLALVDDRSPAPVLRTDRHGSPTLPWVAFAAAAAQAPEAVAVTDASGSVTYAELLRRAEGLAAAIAATGIGPEDVVAVCLERGVAYATALLATIRADAAFLPVDTSLPPERRRQMLEQARARLVLVDPAEDRDRTAAPAVPSLSVHAAGDAGVLPPAAVADPHALAYVMFTSGTTGSPKGAMVETAGMANHIEAKILDLGLATGEVVAQTARVSFDIAIWQYLAPLCAGARVAVLPDEAGADPTALVDELRSHGVTVWEVVPAVLARCLDLLERTGSRLPALRVGMATGEPLSPGLARRWFATLGPVPLVNAYGPTECSDDVTHHVLREPPDGHERRVPIGRPILGVDLYLQDDRGRPLPPGFPGELVVGGIAVGRGYVGDPRRTAEAFPGAAAAQTRTARRYRTGDRARVRDDGALELLGRIDEQLKVNGVRVEPAEIEAVLADHPDVTAAAVRAWDGPHGSRQLCGYVVLHDGAVLDGADLRRRAGDRLPAPAVPTRWEVVDRLPLNRNGKVDRGALPPPSRSAGPAEQPVPPRDAVEAALAGIWSELLEVDGVGVHDNFFELGGDSIRAAQVMSRARSAGLRLTAEQFFATPTIADHARLAAADGADPADPADRKRAAAVSAAAPRRARTVELSPDEWAAIVRTSGQEVKR